MPDQQGNTGLMPAIHRHVDPVLPWFFELQLLDIDDEIAHQKIELGRDADIDRHINAGHDQPAVFIDKIHFDLVMAFFDPAERNAKRDGALRVDRWQLAGDDGIEGP